ncbi:nitroreductase family protein [Metaclostridioides mangenotii]|uniref:nitroreductase family protein n=1 Tax=Metaclostridioides mangenotii TaxID=1540 RepID=UPI00048800D9|nr:nitroreductase family protein [Clostridioides mangenotii]
MNILDAIEIRHSVRSYTDQNIDREIQGKLQEVIDQCNIEGDMNIQLCIDEPNAFSGLMASYGKFKNVKNYIAIVAKKGNNFEERCGYFGEKVVLKATQLGLNTCWVAATYNKGKTNYKINPGEKLCCVIALGYGTTSGVNRKTKSIEQLCSVDGEMPDWLKNGMKSVQLAPTAMNQQKFLFELNGNIVTVKALLGFYTKLDLGIVKYHFEVGAGTQGWKWSE